MGNAWSWLQSTGSCSIDCSQAAGGLAAGAVTAGVGTFYSFYITAFSTIALSLWVLLTQLWQSRGESHERMSREQRRRTAHDRHRSAAIREAVMMSFSDQQLITGLAMAATVRLRFFVHCDKPMSAYHYDIICYLLLCSIVTHLCTIVTVQKYFYPFARSTRATLARTALLLVRCAGIAVVIILTGLILANRNRNTFPVVPPAITSDSNQLLLRPAACYFVGADAAEIVSDIPDTLKNWNVQNWSHGLAQYVLFLLAIMIGVPIAILHSWDRGLFKKAPQPKLLVWLRFGIVLAGLVIVGWTLYLTSHLRNWMHNSGWLGADADYETTWTFSQVISVLILLYAPMTTFHAIADKYDTQGKASDHASVQQLANSGKYGYGLVGSD